LPEVFKLWRIRYYFPLRRGISKGPTANTSLRNARNYLAVVRDLPELWDCFLRLDEIWTRDLSNMRSVPQKERLPVITMFMHSHQQFRIAFELGFSTAISEAWSTMRGSIDTAMVAHKIFREPNLLAVWIRKNDGRAEKNAYKEAFKSANLFPAQFRLAKLQSFYRDYSESGTTSGTRCNVVTHQD